MAQADLIPPPTLRVVQPKPKMTIYYALLIIALLAMLTACLFLYLEIRRFGGFGTVKGGLSAADRTELFFRHREPGVRRDDGVPIVSLISVSSAANS